MIDLFYAAPIALFLAFGIFVLFWAVPRTLYETDGWSGLLGYFLFIVFLIWLFFGLQHLKGMVT